MPSLKHKVIFFLIALFLCSWHLDAGHNDNTMSRALAVAALVEHGSLEITPHHELTGDKALVDGRYYSDKAPLPALMVAPVWWVGKVTGLVEQGEFGYFNDGLLRLGGFLCGSLPLALIIVLLWGRAKERGPRPAVLIAALPLFGSFLFVYSGSFYNHLPGALFSLVAAMALEKRHPLIAGLAAGAAMLCEASLVLFATVWLFQLLPARGILGRFMVGLLPAAVITVLHNLAITGHPFVFPNAFAANYAVMHQRYGFGSWQPEAFWGLTFSAYRGMFFYAPALLALLPFLWHRRGRVVAPSLLRDPFVLPAVMLVLAFFTHATWWGGWAYGPRYLTAGVVLLFARMLPGIVANRSLAQLTIGLSLFGFGCAFLAKSTLWYSLPTGVKDPLVEEVLIRAAAGEWTYWQWPVQLGLSPGMATLLFLLIFAAMLTGLNTWDRATKPA